MAARLTPATIVCVLLIESMPSMKLKAFIQATNQRTARMDTPSPPIRPMTGRWITEKWDITTQTVADNN